MTKSMVFLVLCAGALSAASGAGAPVAPPGPGGHCAPSLQAYFAKDFTDQAYQHKAYQKVAGAWKRPASDPKPGAKAVVIATIARDGKAEAPPPTLHMKSGSATWDAAAMAAVKAAAPFDPLPASYAQPSVEVHFHFACGG